MHLILHMINGDEIQAILKHYGDDEFITPTNKGTMAAFEYNVLSQLEKEKGILKINSENFECDNNSNVYIRNILWFELD